MVDGKIIYLLKSMKPNGIDRNALIINKIILSRLL